MAVAHMKQDCAFPQRLFGVGELLQIPPGGKGHFYSQQSRVPGRVLSCHPLSQSQLSLGIWSLRNYCKTSEALGKTGLRGFFQVIFSKDFFVSEDSRALILPSCYQRYVGKPRLEVVGEH